MPHLKEFPLAPNLVHIDDPGVWRKPEPETPTKPATGYDDSPPPPPEPLAKEYRFKDVSIVEPAQGFEKNKSVRDGLNLLT